MLAIGYRALILVVAMVLTAAGTSTSTSTLRAPLFRAKETAETPEVIEQRIDREREMELKLDRWGLRIHLLKKQLSASGLLSSRRRQLKMIVSSLELHQKKARNELLRMRETADIHWEHLGDHFESELREIVEIYAKFLAE